MVAAAIAMLIGSASAVAPAVAPSASAVGTPVGCSFGSGGDEASSLCWIDFSLYNETTARSVAGQPMSVSLPGGYTASFTLHTADVATHPTQSVASHAFPTYPGTGLGNHGKYTGVAGLPALYTTSNDYNSAVRHTLTGITVRDAANNPVTGFGFVAGDAESSNGVTAPNVETVQFQSDVPLNRIDPAPTVCGNGLTGLGSTSVLCVGRDSTSNQSLFVQANSPTSITATTTESPTVRGLQAVAFAFVQEQVTLTTVVASRVDASDSFDSAITSAGATSGAATTGTTDTSTTGSTTVLPAAADGTVDLAETGTPATTTTLANYTLSWSCSNAATHSTTALPSGGGTSHSIAIAPGDDITCTVTTTAKAIGQSIVTHASAVDTNGDGIIDAGDAVQYTYTVTNTGAVPITNVAVSDSTVPQVSCAATSLAPSASTTCTATTVHTITDAEVVAGSAGTSATVSSRPLGSTTTRTSAPSAASVATAAPAPALVLTQTVSRPAVTTVGQALMYTYTVTNTGNTTLRALAVTPTSFSGSGRAPVISCPTTTLGIGAQTVCTASYTATQSDLDRGSVIDTVVASGTRPGGSTATSSRSTTTTVVAVLSSALTVKASADRSTVGRSGDLVRYDYTVTNTGTSTLHALAISQVSFGGTRGAPAASCPTRTLAPSASVVCTATYEATAEDVHNRSFTDTVVALGTNPSGTSLASDISSVTVTAKRAPAIHLAVVVDSHHPNAGDVLHYVLTVTNTGNVPLSSTDLVARVGDQNVRVHCATSTLAPGEVTTCTAEHTVTATDVENGTVDLRASVTGTADDSEVHDDSSVAVTVVTPPTSGNGTPSSSNRLATTGSDVVPLVQIAVA